MRQLPNLRAAILGSACCGKSSLLHRLAYGEFQEYSVASLGIDMVHLECFQERWVVHDTSGLLAARAIAFDVTIIAFDVASRESWEEARRLLVRHGHPTWSSHRDCVPTPSGETARRAPPPLPAILVATKVDRIADGPASSTILREASFAAHRWGAYFVSTSARSGAGCGTLRLVLARLAAARRSGSGHCADMGAKSEPSSRCSPSSCPGGVASPAKHHADRTAHARRKACAGGGGDRAKGAPAAELRDSASTGFSRSRSMPAFAGQGGGGVPSSASRRIRRGATPPGRRPGLDTEMDVLCGRAVPLPAEGSQVGAWLSSVGTLSPAPNLEAQRLSVEGDCASICTSLHERG